MGLEQFAVDTEDRIDRHDWSDYDESLAAKIDGLIANDEWLSNYKQPYYVTETAQRALEMSGRDMRDRRRRAQKQVLDEVPVENIQTVQNPCHRGLFEDHEAAPEDLNGEKQWHVLFEDVLRSIDQDRASNFPR